jgi:hypothetical protein
MKIKFQLKSSQKEKTFIFLARAEKSLFQNLVRSQSMLLYAISNGFFFWARVVCCTILDVAALSLVVRWAPTVLAAQPFSLSCCVSFGADDESNRRKRALGELR